MNVTQSSAVPRLPHHRLIAFEVANQLLLAVRDAHIRDAKLRDEALRSAKSSCLNTAEGAGRVTRADKARAFEAGVRWFLAVSRTAWFPGPPLR